MNIDIDQAIHERGMFKALSDTFVNLISKNEFITESHVKSIKTLLNGILAEMDTAIDGTEQRANLIYKMSTISEN